MASADAHTVTPPVQYIVLLAAMNQRGVAAVQAAHVAAESIRCLPVSNETIVRVLAARDTDELRALSARLKELGIHHVLNTEPDPPYKGVCVALGVEPMEEDRIKPLMAGLKVFR